MADAKKTVFITGSTRGIGLAFAQYYTDAGWNVIGTARTSSNTDKLNALSPFKVVTLDSSDEASIVDAARQLEGVAIDLVINNAGVGVRTTFETVTRKSFMDPFEVNAVGPFFVTRALLPNLKLAVKARGSAAVLQISSLLGSIASNKDDHADIFRGIYGYCASKVALNMVTRSLAMDLRDHNVVVAAVNPGYVDTDLAGGQGIIKPADAVAAMDAIVAKLSMDDSGKFFNADPAIPSAELPW